MELFEVRILTFEGLAVFLNCRRSEMKEVGNLREE